MWERTRKFLARCKYRRRIRKNLKQKEIRAKEYEYHKILTEQEYEYREEQYHKGNAFEDYVLAMFSDNFELIHRTPTHEETQGRYVKAMSYPDLRFIDRTENKRFWVEVKYRSSIRKDGNIEWCNDMQLGHYRQTAQQTGDDVYIMIGVGGTTQSPNVIYCLNLAKIRFTLLYPSTYSKHIVKSRKITSVHQLEEWSSNNK